MGVFIEAGMEKHALEVLETLRMAAALAPCAAGIVVAVPATCGYTYGGTRLDLLVKGPPRRNRLARPFTEVTSFGLIAAWLLALIIRVFVIPLTPVHVPEGLHVAITPVPCDTSDRFIVLRITNRGGIFVNGVEQDWRSLPGRLSEIYRTRPYSSVYLLAEDEVRFETVADAIDVVHGMNIPVPLVTPRAVNGDCPLPHLTDDPTPRASR